ncbi:acyl-CoA carboxylase subunit epsilon [Cryobacterium melibiosiphilum]|uniref:Acyl-CoA carboxylase subunit epsilon n=1 Tax=Cryobacterium melibiosiphilum TaxID=995039 RepID=A0A3A5MCC4_9MICO|nr:acyl-CoA carboxylase subunit epsilon [Cryobacterium melibiosiphilum]RJT87780.1 acyl-CoA carboxylase subunit epsilon [Cryobacterium melibiosiphilum]
MTESTPSAPADVPAPAAAPPAPGIDPAEIIFVSRNVTAMEASAVTAVLQGLLQEESDGSRTAPARGQSAWQRSTRSIRTPLHPGPGQWRSFSA